MKPKLIFVAIIFTSNFFLSQNLFAEPHDTMGVIELEEDRPDKDPFKVNQENSVSYFEKLVERTSELAEGKISETPAPADEILNHLTAVYLYCVKKQGICPSILDAVLEIDIINSKIANKASCPTMLRFWKKWMANDMEKRQKYMIQTSFLKKAGDFNTNTRPKYIQCTETVKKEIKRSIDPKVFFDTRYQSNSPIQNTIKKTHAMLKEIQQNIPNVFVEIGASSGKAITNKE